MRLYTPLELAGRNIYIREGCYACHSQMIRTLRDEVERYGPYSLAVESQVRPPDALGLEADRTGPRARRRQIFRLLACRPSDQSARRRSGVEHARLPLAGPHHAQDGRPRPCISRRSAPSACPTPTRWWRTRHDDAYGQATPDTDFAAGVIERYGEETQVSAFDGVTTHVTEMDALVAYLQVLGTADGRRIREYRRSRGKAGSGKLKAED